MIHIQFAIQLEIFNTNTGDCLRRRRTRKEGEERGDEYW
jgi:hypothetical protein